MPARRLWSGAPLHEDRGGLAREEPRRGDAGARDRLFSRARAPLRDPCAVRVQRARRGLRGATALGFERQYYDVAHRDLVRWLGANAPKNARLHFLPNNWEYERTYRWYRQAGELRADLRIVNREVDADLLVLTHERRFARYAQDLRRHRGRPVLLEKRVDGVPLWTVLDLRGAR